MLHKNGGKTKWKEKFVLKLFYYELTIGKRKWITKRCIQITNKILTPHIFMQYYMYVIHFFRHLVCQAKRGMTRKKSIAITKKNRGFTMKINKWYENNTLTSLCCFYAFDCSLCALSFRTVCISRRKTTDNPL